MPNTKPTTAQVAKVTQVRYTGRAMVRTFVQTVIPALIGLGVFVPWLMNVILEEIGSVAEVPDWVRMTLLGTATVFAVVASILAKVMGNPQVEKFLQSHSWTNWLAAAPPPGRHTDLDGDGVPDHLQ